MNLNILYVIIFLGSEIVIKVVAALIMRDNKVLIARRSTGDENVMGKW